MAHKQKTGGNKNKNKNRAA